jgi:SAM-dependent methyltransferase
VDTGGAGRSGHVVRVGYDNVSQQTAARANRSWWDDEADAYQDEHGPFLAGGKDPAAADFVWCPEGLREADVRLLGAPHTLSGTRVLEVGCGAAQCARWLAREGAYVAAMDLSAHQLRHAQAAISADAEAPFPLLLQADAMALPFAAGTFDLACSAFGAVPFLPDSAAVMREVARVLRPAGRWVFSTNHPMRWCFRDDPGPEGLVVERSYFDRRSYVERDDDGDAVYVEAHRTMGDRVRELVAAGFAVLDVVEPEWPADHLRPWGQWSPLRGALFPGTVILVAERRS